MTIQPARHECHACCPLQAEKPGIQPVVGNTHDTHVEQVISSFQKILRGSQLTWYMYRLAAKFAQFAENRSICRNKFSWKLSFLFFSF